MKLEIFSDLDIQGENWRWQNENKQVKCKKKEYFGYFPRKGRADSVRFGVVSRSAELYDKMN